MLEISYGPAPGPKGFDWDPVIGLAPHLIWAAVIVFVLLYIGPATLRTLATRVEKVGAAGFEISFRQSLTNATVARGKPVLVEKLDIAAHRLASQQALLEGARLLWVDDHPNWNENEIRLFEGAGARVDTVETSGAAEAAIARYNYDVVISDIEREGSATEGIRFASQQSGIRNSPPLIFYVGTALLPVPKGAFGICDRPDELVHLVLDVLGRSRS